MFTECVDSRRTDSRFIDAMDIPWLLSRISDEKLRDVLCMRYGLNGYGTYTLREIGEKYQVSPSRAQQLVAQARRQMQHPGRLDGYFRDDWVDLRRKEKFERGAQTSSIPINTWCAAPHKTIRKQNASNSQTRQERKLDPGIVSIIKQCGGFDNALQMACYKLAETERDSRTLTNILVWCCGISDARRLKLTKRLSETVELLGTFRKLHKCLMEGGYSSLA